MAHAFRSIVILGGGTAGWMTAAAMARFLPPAFNVTLVESEAIGTVGVGEATIPQIRLFNEALEIDEPAFLAATQATYKLGIQFDGWARPGHRYMHAFGSLGRAMGILPFHQIWLAEHAQGNALPLGHYAVNEVAALRDRFAHLHPKAGAPVPDIPYAFHFDAGLYAAFLRRYAERRGVRRVEGRVAHVVHDGTSGDIVALHLDDGRAIAGDFFIDCSGFRARLLCDAMGAGFEDWSHWLPCDRALAVPSARPEGSVTPYTRSTAQPAGWQWRIPLQHRTGNGHVYCSAFMSDEDARDLLLAGLDASAEGAPRPLRFTAGRRREAWRGNCVAIGLAAGFLEPLESTSIHLVQTAIARLISMLPGERLVSAEIAVFNRQTAFEYERIRDFLILHYRLNARPEPFWAGCRAMPLPDSLAEKLAIFEASGRVFREADELFTEAGWVQVMIGQGLLPATCDRIAAALDGDARRRLLEQVAGMCDEVSNALPDHGDYVAEMVGRARSLKEVA